MTKPALLCAAFLAGCALPLGAQPVWEYRLRLEEPQAHLLQVELTVPAARPHQDFSLPAWAPGSYQIANYAKFVQDFAALDAAGRSLPVIKIDKQTWRVTTAGGNGNLTIRYRVLANLLSDTESEFNEEHAQVFGPQVFMYAVNQPARPVRLRVMHLRGWRIATGLTAVDDSTFQARDYDEFIDAPLEIGNFLEVRFPVAGRLCRLVMHGEQDSARVRNLAQQLHKIVAEQIQMMGGPPFPEYVFIWHVDPRAPYYGLEHLNSTSIGMPHRPGDMRDAAGVSFSYSGLQRQDIDLEYAAHEFFHLWNVKRIRPRELGPFDYTREVHTAGLWIAEGWTDYYGYLTLLRTGLWPRWKWLRLYANLLTEYRRSSGWRFRSPQQASIDTWLWAYGSGEQGNLAQTYFSYYPHGNLLALCMDLRIRSESRGRCSLDDVMRALLARFGLPRPGFTTEQFWQCLSEVTAMDWRAFRRDYVEGTLELPVDDYLKLAGIKIDTLSHPDASYLGVSVREQDQQAIVAAVAWRSSAAQAGLEVGDRWLALDGQAVTPENWQSLLARKAVGSQIELLIARHGRIRRLHAVLQPQPPVSYDLRIVEEEDPEVTALRQAWWRPYVAVED
ncbi:MAG: PDZ domain-containing protein [candidate division KSB1 bacterium]|nr:PDZ domain-containing protein [candidate division KSB1 bacterium]MDZ7275081.1 PDZ domain-containing protein [candidate division KSB1 bacterium]MDZ7286471.1 PDZ domain-containing protein [candidate division KSB1 bacterium]MDZ7299365.1 PDZ domain-containing protein [candidate division KSB1 bacterium]MDZ7306306.1 PDZ domain-containing protein [candidate division KSB1 bacterium]